MTFDPTTLAVIAVMTIAAALCRLSGFWFMRFIPITPRVEAALKAIPLAIMIGIIVPPVLRGGIAEAAGLIATLVTMRFSGNDVAAIVAGMGSVALCRYAGL